MSDREADGSESGPSARRALRDVESLFRDLTETLRQVIYVCTYDYSRTFFVSPAFRDIWGVPCETVYVEPLNWMRALHPDDRTRVETLVRDSIGRGGYAAEYRVVRPDGSVRWIWDQAWEIPGPDGRPDRVAGIAEDITDRKARESALAEASTRLRMVTQHAPGLLWAVDRTLTITFLAGQAAEALGPKIAQAVGMSLYDHLGTKDPDDVSIRACREALGGKSSVFERESQGRQYRTFVEPLRGADGGIGGAIAFSVDETERRKAEIELEAWKERYETAIRVSGQILYDADPAAGTVVFGGDAARMLGHPAESLSGPVTAWVERLHPEDQAGFVAMLRKAHDGKTPFHLDYRVRHRNGTWVTVMDDGFPLADAQGVVRRHVGLLKDVTSTRRMEEELFQAQKMESIGRLAGGIAHDFNNLLTTILGYTEIVLRQLDQTSALRPEVMEIKEAGLRAAGLTRQLLAFSRKQVLRPRVIDLNEVVRGIEKILRRTIGDHIALKVALGGDVGRVRADPSQLEQVLLNLVVNARDAMEKGGGRVKVSTSSRTVQAGAPEDFSGTPPGVYVELRVEDDGAGMDAETMSHLFEPFFTTKPHGKGTGLGLSTVYGIVKQSGGFIGVDSAPGKGTRIAILLPVSTERLDEDTRRFVKATSSAGSEVVLLVEDEDAVRELAGEILRREGYVVLKARHGEEGLKAARRHAGPIDLVLTDVVMPEMGGPEMVRQLLEIRPDVRVMYMSGYTRDALLTRENPLGPSALLLEKPFTPESLAGTVRKALDRPAK